MEFSAIKFDDNFFKHPPTPRFFKTNFIIEFFTLFSEVTFCYILRLIFLISLNIKNTTFLNRNLMRKKIDEKMLEEWVRKAITLSLPFSNDLNLNVKCEVMDVKEKQFVEAA